MAWKKVESLFATPWTPEKKGDALEGIYLGTEEIDSNQSNGSFTSYRIQRKDGAIFGATGALLENTMGQIPAGSLVRIVYEGTVKLKSGRTGKDFTVMVDDSVNLLDPITVLATARAEARAHANANNGSANVSDDVAPPF